MKEDYKPVDGAEYISLKDAKRLKLPFYETVAAGFPSPASDYQHESLDMNDKFVHHPEASYFVRVRGESMIGLGILDGDICLADRQEEVSDDNIRVDNHAVNGRSSLSFINEGRWDKVLEKMKPGDYVIIQFGHNDEKPQADRHTDPGSTFDNNLAKFVRETREHGGIPVLMNAVVRRNFAKVAPKNDDDEKLRNTTFADGAKTVEGDSLVDTHGLYSVAPRDVAQRMHCHFVDANKITHDLEQGLGREGSKRLHMWFLPGQEPTEPKGKQDNTHYNVYGATVVARLLADALCEEIPLLKKYRVATE